MLICNSGGRQFFTDPRIGDFSITFAERDGAGQGEGLTTPNLQLAYVNNWQEFPVHDLAVEFYKHRDCEQNGASPFRDCGDGPFVCHFG